MKRWSTPGPGQPNWTFSALGRAVWDETSYFDENIIDYEELSVLSVEPYGMKQMSRSGLLRVELIFQCSRSSRMG